MTHEITLPDGLGADEAADVLREYATTDDAQIVSADTLSAKEDAIDELAGVFRDALKAQKDLPDETVNGMGVDALTAAFRNEDGEIEADTLTQEPETGTAGGEPDDEDGGVDALSADEKAEVEDKLRRADLLEDRTPDHADTLRSEAADLVGVDSADEIELEAY